MISNTTYKDNETHTYYVAGIPTPSVTDICEPIAIKRLLELPKQVLERARQRGTRVHELCQDYLLTQDIDWEDVETEYAPFMEQFVEWARTYKPKVLYTEFEMFDSEFCGTLDLICEIDNKVILVDYKTSSAVDKQSLSVQFAGYGILCEKHQIKIDDFYCLHLKKEAYVFKPIEPNRQWFEVLHQHNKFMRGVK